MHRRLLRFSIPDVEFLVNFEMSRLLIILFACAAVHPVLAAEKPFAFGTVHFEANRGQADPSVRYLARARGQQIFFTDTGLIFSPPSGPSLRMSFAGASRPNWAADGPPSDSISYYLGRDPNRWVKAAPVYDRISWRGVYPGVDLIFYGDGDRLEYDLILAPGADPARLRLQFASSARVSAGPGGDLEISEGSTTIRQRVPTVYQDAPSGARRRINGAFQPAGQNAATLRVATYDPARSLVVDPVIEMATYLGGENDDEIVAVADGFVAGNTRSIAFPPTQPSLRGGRDVFFRGTGPVIPSQMPRPYFSGTYVFGGSGDDELAGIALQPSGSSVSLAGTTTSQDLPGAGNSQYNGGASDGFVATVVVSKTYANVDSTQYIGGSGDDRITAFSGDGTSYAMVGVTDSPDLPVSSGVPQRSIGGGKDAFFGLVSKTFGYEYYGYLGGSGDDAAYAVSFRSFGRVWIGGETHSSDFPFPVAGIAGPSDAFLAEIYVPVGTPSTGIVTVTTYRVGGNGEDSIRALAAVPSNMTASLGSTQVLRPFTLNNLGFAGTTTSTDLPVRNAAFPRLAGERDVFAGIWNFAEAAPHWMTYLGGSGVEESSAVTMDWAGDLYVGGWTRSTDLPVFHAAQPTSSGGEEGMFAVFDVTGTLHQLTYYGGSGDDRIRDVKLVYGSVARVAGSTTSTDLPERTPTQDRGGRAEGFWADIGTDYLIAPSELILAKDGVLSFSVRPGRTAYRFPVTYRSSDPSRVRLVYLGRSFDEVTAAPEDNIDIEALTDSGEATINISAPGFTSREILVRLYPGVFQQYFSASDPISTWSTPINLAVMYRAQDPATGQLVGAGMSIRAGATQPIVSWSVSDPSVFQIINNGGSFQLRVLRAGDATLRLAVDGFSVYQADKTITAATPRPFPSNQDIRLGRDLSTYLPLYFGLNGTAISTGYRGTLTARSSDPGRLLLSSSSTEPGRESVTVTMSGLPPAIHVQALAGEGTVQVVVTSSEFEGEIPLTVTLEPSVIRWGVYRYVQSVGSVLETVVPLTAGSETASLAISLEAQSGGGSSAYRPGAPPVTLTVSNSEPKVVELNRLTTTLGGTGESYKLLGLTPGTAELRLTSSSDLLRPANDSVRVDVAAPASAVERVDLPAIVYVGKGLQAAVNVRYYAPRQTLELSSSDPDAVVIAPSQLAQGSANLSLAPTQAGSGEYLFFLQGLKSEGESRLRLHFPTGEEREIRVVLLPSGVGFYGMANSTATPGFDRSQRVQAWALDRQTGIGLFAQPPQPGLRFAVRFRSEGAPVRIGPETATLTADADYAEFKYSLPPAGQEATLIVESDADAAVSPVTATMRIRAATASPVIDLMLLARNELRALSIVSYTNRPALTATSSDPDLILLSPTPSAPASAALDLAKPGSSIYLHALAETGNATVRLKSAGVTVLELQVALQPLIMKVNANGAVIPGRATDYMLSLNASLLRPNSGPFKFTVQAANPAVATVDPPLFEFGGAKGTVSVKLPVTGVAPGTTRIIFEGPPEIVTYPLSVTVSESAQSSAPEYTLGRNLQGGVQLDLGPGFDNPNGAIVNLTSSEPGRLLLSRSASVAGTASISVAVPAGARLMQQVFLQALEAGDVLLQMTMNNATRTVAIIHVVNSWVSCGAQVGAIEVGRTVSKGCSIVYMSSSLNSLQPVSPRTGLGELNLRLESSVPDIFTVTPQSVSLQSPGAEVSLLGVSPGVGELRLTPPAGFGPSPSGSETMAVTVVASRLSTLRSTEILLGKDTQTTFTIFAPAGVTVTARSQDAARLLVSANPKQPGAVTATALSNGTSVDFTLQGLAGTGTAEVVLTAPGYQDLRIAVALRPTEFDWIGLPDAGTPLMMSVGSSATLGVGLRTTGNSATPRAGVNLPVDVLTDREGIVTLDPARVVIDGPEARAEVKLRALAPGSVLLHLSSPEGFPSSATPAFVAVVP
jgi:hypothetical protein